MINMDACKASVLWFAALLPLLILFGVECLFHGADAVPPAAQALGTAALTLLISYLMGPVLWNNALLLPRHVALWSILTASIALLLIAAASPSGAWPTLALPLAGGVLMLCLLLGTLTLFLHWIFRLPVAAVHRLVLCTLIITGTMPLWLGPLADLWASRAFTDLVIALSPVGYLASLIDYDVLRSGWFYTHTPLGGLRYDYPNPVVLSLTYSGLVALMSGIGGARRFRFTGEKDKPFAPFLPDSVKERTT
jgi:hypothetical protein